MENSFHLVDNFFILWFILRGMTFLEAIGRMEGADIPGSRPNRNNNPGDIDYGKFAQAHGGTLEAGNQPRFAVFPTMEAGYDALKSLLQCGAYKGLTVEQAINKYAPPSENNTTNYVNLICKWTDCSPSECIDNLL